MSTKKTLLNIVPPPKKSRAEELLAPPEDFDLNFDEITRLLGGSAANGDKNDPVVIEGTAEVQLRKIIAKYGFERLPFTYGELQGLVQYCDRLESITGRRSCPPAEQALWRVGSFLVWGKTNPELMPAARLYAVNDLAGLKILHSRDDTLTSLGQQFKEFDDEASED